MNGRGPVETLTPPGGTPHENGAGQNNGYGPPTSRRPGRFRWAALAKPAGQQHGAPRRSPGRLLRRLTGVDEAILGQVPQERPRYTRLGGIILGTSIMAMLSMLDALFQVFGVTGLAPVLVLVAMFWGTFVCIIDGWLIASTHGCQGLGRRLAMFAPRIVLALIFGTIIAVPLLLTTFSAELVQQVQDQRSAALVTYQSHLTLCNPLSPAAKPARLSGISCAGMHLAINDPAAATMNTLAKKQYALRNIKTEITHDNSQEAGKQKFAQKECAGVSGAGLSGNAGVGNRCNYDRAVAKKYIVNSDLNRLPGQRNQLTKTINGLEKVLPGQEQTYGQAVTKAIHAAVATRRSHQRRIGLLDRITALGSLSSHRFAVWAASWLLFLFILFIDCLPVLSKLMSGNTKYDQLLDYQLDAEVVVAQKAIEVERLESVERKDLYLAHFRKYVKDSTPPP